MATNQLAGKECGAGAKQPLAYKAYPNRETRLEDLHISRALPIRERRMVGPWCFLDRFGPLTFADNKPMNVPPHPHIGLQTVSWLLEGEVLHTDSLNSEAILYPGGVNVMTAGKGIAHAEETPPENRGLLNGVQLWVALLDEHRNIAPTFTNVEQVPNIDLQGGQVMLFAGTIDAITSPAPNYSEILGAQVNIELNQTIDIPLNTHYEHAVMLLDGTCSLYEGPLAPKTLYYLGLYRENLAISSPNGCRTLLIGGRPFPEKILMWWNFVARTSEEISQARADWEAHRRFDEVRGTQLEHLSAPDLARFAQPNPIS